VNFDPSTFTDLQLHNVLQRIKQGTYPIELESVPDGKDMATLQELGKAQLIRQIEQELDRRRHTGEKIGKVLPYAIPCSGISHHITHMNQITSDVIQLEREPMNPYDRFAIKVLMVRENGSMLHLGYVKKELARHIKDDVLPARGKIIWRTKDPKRPGIRIMV
jgi:hypothetical protein